MATTQGKPFPGADPEVDEEDCGQAQSAQAES
jgi:hypothetical protein